MRVCIYKRTVLEREILQQRERERERERRKEGHNARKRV